MAKSVTSVGHRDLSPPPKQIVPHSVSNGNPARTEKSHASIAPFTAAALEHLSQVPPYVVYAALARWLAQMAEATSTYGSGTHPAQLRAVAQQQLAIYELRASLHPSYRLSSIELRVLPELDEFQAGRSSRLFAPVDNPNGQRASKENRTEPAIVWMARSFAIAAADALQRLTEWKLRKCLRQVVKDIEGDLPSDFDIDDVLPTAESSNGDRNSGRRTERSAAELKIERAVKAFERYRGKLNEAKVPYGRAGPTFILYQSLLAQNEDASTASETRNMRLEELYRARVRDAAWNLFCLRGMKHASP